MSEVNWAEAKPQGTTKVDHAFGGDMKKLLPPWDVIPKEFKDDEHKFCVVISSWFFSGMSKNTQFIMKPGIDENQALGHIASILRSFDPKHEHKTAGCAYLMSLWFEDVKTPDKV